MLAQQLRQLERDGIVDRKVYPQVPPKVEYKLTPLGLALGPLLDSMGEWGQRVLDGRWPMRAPGTAAPRRATAARASAARR